MTEALLRPVVQVPYDATPLRVVGGGDPRPRRGQLGARFNVRRKDD
jgi:hypothetical protein